MTDAWPIFTSSKDAGNFIKTMKRDKDTYIFTRLPQFENFKGNRENLFAALRINNVNYQIIKIYANVLRQPMIQLLLVPAITNRYIRALQKWD